MGRVFHHEIRRGDSDWHREEAGGLGGSFWPCADTVVIINDVIARVAIHGFSLKLVRQANFAILDP